MKYSAVAFDCIIRHSATFSIIILGGLLFDFIIYL